MIRKIKNFDELAINEIRRKALEIVEAGLWAIDTPSVIKEIVSLQDDHLQINGKSFNLKEYKRIFVVGVGKCSMEAAVSIEDVLGDKLTDGIAIDVSHFRTAKKIKFLQGDHPLPTEANIDATKKIIKMLEDLEEDDFVIFIISGGGSTLLCQPDNFTCTQEKDIIQHLMENGGEIKEINTLRKHLSLARGGFLAKYAYPAKAISLIFSDIPGGDLSFVASGPTFKDTTTVEDAKRVIEKYKVHEKFGFDEEHLIETPKEDKYFEKVENILAVSNEKALKAMNAKAQELGLKSEICADCLEGEARDMGKKIIDELSEAPSGTALIYGGETTVTVLVPGKGGRNQELVLSALRYIKEGQVLIAVGSDGRDNTDHAGSLCDIITKEKMGKNDLDAQHCIDHNCSYDFFTKINDYIDTGYTGSNVSDLLVAIKE
ncbi:MAG: hypothetical protein COV29_03245 [Candidatus Yanofskybacteria bacterium CG10_big_fil_rev_8_21_14_0_10_36_16]|uniref:Glycerate kinase n=1 Tax=Candidatus Yanofskybacteria bacterium CG10_big_fil_rev_8_21_14_0_10_36_16 TaxID=1975096 RepID=A0A2J0Q9R4_9BACT|nr:MAG: hypothetical protein COV29_03245 [Candidatus Yanofskybacteria bacterium CG10_big_fil_rev_8_21_14_0_10_36_16]